jgi:glycerophosphoryl diester phosphodiesterase
VIRIGHRGAAALAPPNSIAGVRAALAAGVDMIEFDVSPGLVVAHDPGRPGPALRDFIAEAAKLAPPEVGFLVDLKAAGYEDEALEAVADAGLADRSTFASLEIRSLRRLAGHARTSFSYSRRHPGPLRDVFRRQAPRRYAASGAADATMRASLVTPRLVDAVHSNGGRVYAWTVNKGAAIERLAALGVDGVITDNPTVFASRPGGSANGTAAGTRPAPSAPRR